MDAIMIIAKAIAHRAETLGDDPEAVALDYVHVSVADVRKAVKMAKIHYGLLDSEWPEDFLYCHRWLRLRRVEKRLDKRI